MKILILGHKGMLGSDLFARLCIDHVVVGKDIGDFDLTSEDACLRVVEETVPEIIINAAAYTNVDGAEENKDLCYAVNAQGVKNLVEASRGRRIKIVHFSTDYVFDGTKDKPYSETDIPNPINVYGASKEAGEKFLQAGDNEFLLIRTAWLYGKHGKNFVTTILAKTKNEKKLSVVDDQIGSPTYTWDLAGAVKVLLEGGHNGIFHITNRGLCSWYEFTLKILQYTGIKGITVEPARSADLTRAARRPLFSGLSNKKFTETTGKTMRVWQLALSDFVDNLESDYR
ncbi:MAG: dTDP-4-dehydrorhamnose reductase [Syntrophales bacterium]|nr:dTDP-4-dehydrorhamnose reductase [Syntrophales bacterium]